MKTLIFILISLFLLSCATEQKIPQYQNEEQLKDDIYSNNYTDEELFIALEPFVSFMVSKEKIDDFYMNNDDLEKFLIAMIILESNRLQSNLSYQDNILGIKCLKTRPCIDYKTNEYINNKNTSVTDGFSVFYSWSDCVHNWFTIIKSDRYIDFRHSTTVEQMCLQIKICGYATDPAYPEKLYKLIQKISKNDE